MSNKLALLALLGLWGCNSHSSYDNPGAPGIDFVNHTSVSPAVLETQWNMAQDHLATKPINLNAAISTPKIVPADQRAWKVQPTGIVVNGVDDSKSPGKFYADFCKCWVHGYVNLSSPVPIVYVAASKASSYAEYEFENVILHRLGYNTDNR